MRKTYASTPKFSATVFFTVSTIEAIWNCCEDWKYLLLVWLAVAFTVCLRVVVRATVENLRSIIWVTGVMRRTWQNVS